MTREEHIAAAERLLRGEFHPSLYPNGLGWHANPTEREVAQAQVHATLALAVVPSAPPGPELEELIDPPLVSPWGRLPGWWQRVVSR
jgi:hypothetical protein